MADLSPAQVQQLLTQLATTIQRSTSVIGGFATSVASYTTHINEASSNADSAKRERIRSRLQLDDTEIHARRQRQQKLQDALDRESSLFSKKIINETQYLEDHYNLQNQHVEAAHDSLRQNKKAAEQEQRVKNKLLKDQVRHHAAINAKRAEIDDLFTSSMAEDIEQRERLEAELASLVASLDNISNQLTDTDKKLTKHNAEVAHITSTLDGYNKDLEETAAKLRKANVIKSIAHWADGLATSMQTAAIALGTKGVWDTLATARKEISRQGSIGETWNIDTARLGMSRPEYAELMGEYRRTMLALGGLRHTTQMLVETNGEYYDITGDYKEATEVRMQMLDMYAKAGVRVSTDQLSSVAKSFKDVGLRSGITLKQYADTLKSITEEETVQAQLRMASSAAEREAILKNNQARFNEYIKLGMTAEQATAAAKAMNRLAGEGPKERFQKGIKMAAVMGAMGIGGGADVMRIMAKPKNRWTKEESDIMARSTTELSNVMATSMGGDNLGSALATQALGESTGITEDFLKDFNTNAIDPLRASIDQNASVLGRLDSTLNRWADALGAMDTIKNLVTLAIPVMMVLGAVGGVAALVPAIKALGGLKNAGGVLSNVGKGLLGRFGKPTTAAGTPSVVGSAVDAITSPPGITAGGRTGSSLIGLARGLGALATPKVYRGIGALTLLAVPLGAAGIALQTFADVKWEDAALGVSTIGGLAVVAAGLSVVSKPMLIGAAAVAALGGSMWIAGQAAQVFASAFKTFGDVNWTGLGTGMSAFGKGLAEMVSEAPNPIILTAVSGSIGALGLSLIPFSAGLSLVDNTSFTSFVDNMTALSNVDPNKLDRIASSMQKISNAATPSIGSAISTAITSIWSTAAPDDSRKEADHVADAETKLRLEEQLRKMDKTNIFLEQVARGTDTMVDIAKKQLLAATMSEQEKQEVSSKNSSRRSGMVGLSQFQYI